VITVYSTASGDAEILNCFCTKRNGSPVTVQCTNQHVDIRGLRLGVPTDVRICVCLKGIGDRTTGRPGAIPVISGRDSATDEMVLEQFFPHLS